jgi:PAS domain S-box-containing protein
MTAFVSSNNNPEVQQKNINEPYMKKKDPSQNKPEKVSDVLEKESRRWKNFKRILDENEDIYKKMWESSLSGIYVSQDGVFKAVNPLMSSLTGFSMEELIGKKSDSIIFPEDKNEVKQNARAMLGGQRSSPYEFRILTKEGNVYWVLETVTSTVFNGKPAILGNFMSITERKEVESRLQQSEKLYRAIFETTGAATIINEEDMTIALINTTFERMTGYYREEWQGKRKWTEYIAEEDLDMMVKAHRLRRIDPEAAPKQFEHSLIDSWGRVRKMYLTVDLIPGTKRSIASFVDITEWKEAEQALKNREQELQTKSRNLEELNTALRVLLKQRENDRAELEEKVLANVKEFVLPYVEKIRGGKADEKSVAYLGSLESNLKDIIAPFSRKLSSKYLNLTPKEIQIANFIKEGKTSKEIADIMNVSKSAIDIHRYRLRNKLGLNHKKSNLRSLLTSIP